MRWRKVFRGEERQLGTMRRWLASLLPAVPARDDVILVATELASNAICHTASGHGGRFTVEITWWQSAVRVGVTDGGGPGQPQVVDDPAGERGRGLLLVTGLSLRTGTDGNHHGRLVWADVGWDGPGPTAGAVMPRTAPARGRRGEPGRQNGPAVSVAIRRASVAWGEGLRPRDGGSQERSDADDEVMAC